MKSSAIVLCTALVCAVLFSTAGGAINPILSYQGFLRDNNGIAYPDGSYEFTFTIYADSTGGTPLWSETQLLSVADGLVFANLGSVAPLGQNVFNSAPLWLGVKLDTEEEFTPRHFIGASVYAFVAADAEALAGFSVEHFADTTDLQQVIDSHESDPLAHRPLDLDASEIVSGIIDPARLPEVQVGSAEVIDGSLQSEDLADSVITGNKIAAGSIESTHLSGVTISGAEIVDGSITGADIQDGSITGADIQLASIGFNEISPQVIADYHIANASISGYKLKASTVSGFEVEDLSIGANDLADNSILTRHLANSQVNALKIADEPGVRETTSGLLTSVGTTPTSWFSVTVNTPAPGYVIVFFNCYASLQSNEAAQVSLSKNPNVFDNRLVEARLSSGGGSIGGNIPIAISSVFSVMSAGPVTFHANVRAAASSAGPVDYVSGALQAIYIPSIY